MQLHEYASRDEYEAVQIRVSQQKAARDNTAKHRHMIEALAPWLRDGARVLCAGARNENELRAFHERAAQAGARLGGVVGIDLSAPRGSAALRFGDMMELEFPDDSFDVVYAHHSLEHTCDPARAAKELLRVAAPGAVMSVTVPYRYPAGELECVSFESHEDLLRLFEAGAGETLLLRECPAGEDLAEELELRWVFRTAGAAPSATVAAPSVAHIRDKLASLGCPVESFRLGDFDRIGELTARRERSADSPEYARSGCFYRPNYERGLLIHALITHFGLRSYLEIGFGRGYSAVCAARAMSESGLGGSVESIDPRVDHEQIERMTRAFPDAWLSKITLHQGTSEEVLPCLEGRRYDLIYIDGDHREAAVRFDWEWAERHFDRFVLFDDYHARDRGEPDIECSRVIDAISGFPKELILMDRRIFVDDRRVADADLDYGQVLVSRDR